MSELSRRGFIHISAASGAAAALAACAPAAAPAAPAAPASSGPSAQVPAWQKEWDDLAAAAKKEGTLVIVSPVGSGYRKALDSFRQAFPGVEVEQTQLVATQFAPKVLAESKAVVNAYDVIVTSHATAGLSLYTNGLMDPVREAIIRSDLKDDKTWRGGFEAGFPDKDKKWAYAAFSILSDYLWINTDLVAPDEIKTVDDLLTGKWKGKIISGDPKSNGYGSTPGTALRLAYGDDIIKRLWKDQEIVLTVDSRLLTESLVRGRYPISIGMDPSILSTFQQEGLGKNVRPVRVPNMQSVSASQDVLYIFKTKPHPNADKLFLNWYLTQEGQKVWAEAGVNNSRRVDVEPLSPDRAPQPGVKYFSSETAEGIAGLAETY
ncbi:MAG: extracellular solute-binding protein, partial [Chloroflexota bacterium]